MNNHFSILLLVLFSTGLSAQVSLERAVVGSLGQSVTSSSLQVSATAGEAAISTLSGSDLLLTQGFHQAEREDFTSVHIVPTVLSDLAVYPNPASGQFWIRVTVPAAQSLRFEVLDANGRRLSNLSRNLSAGIETSLNINAADWPAGLYLVRLLAENGTLAGSARLVVSGN